MDEKTHKKLFAKINYNTDPTVRWPVEGQAWKGAVKGAYDGRFSELIKNGITITSVKQLDNPLEALSGKSKPGMLRGILGSNAHDEAKAAGKPWVVSFS